MAIINPSEVKEVVDEKHIPPLYVALQDVCTFKGSKEDILADVASMLDQLSAKAGEQSTGVYMMHGFCMELS